MSAAAMSGCPASMQATIMRYLLTKPLNGGRPMMDTMPMLMQPTAHGISWTRPARSIFTALAELSTRQIAESMQATGLEENKVAGRRGGGIAKQARKELEEETGRKVISQENGLPPGSEEQ